MAIQAQMYPGLALGGSQDLLMENACGINNLCFIPQQQKEQELMQRIPFLPKNMDDHHSASFSQSISAHVEDQRIEMDLLINSQNERLRMALQEQRKNQISHFMKKYESEIESLIKQKDEEIAKAANRAMQLQNHLKRLEIENQTWERSAKENEAMVASLSSSIQRLRETAPSAAEDAESCCLEGERERETWGQERRRMVCRCCSSRNSCVIMLPCRHLCSCKDCEVFLDSCPVCKMVKKASIEALV